MKNRSIKCILLDIGDVLIEIDPSQFSKTLGLKGDHSIEQIRLDPMHDMYERRVISSKEFFLHIKNEIHFSGSIEEVEKAWNSVLGPEISGVERVLQEYAAKASIFALSNTDPSHLAHILKTKTYFQYIQKVFASFELGHRKPEKEIFLQALKQIPFAAEEILFVDDRAENIEMALSLGFCAERCYRNEPGLEAIFKKYQFESVVIH